jgi:HEAT repeat protein
MRSLHRHRPSPPAERLLRLARGGDPRMLLEAARDPSLDIARRALTRLAHEGGPRERDALRDLVWACDDALAGDVARTLRALDDRETLAMAVARLRSGPPAARCRASRVLERLGDTQARPALRDALGDRDASVRGAVLNALAQLGRDREAAGAAAVLVGDPVAEVRRRAVRAVGRLSDHPAPLIATAINDESPPVRGEAARLAARLPLGDVRRLLADREIEVRRTVAANAGRGAEGVLAHVLARDGHPSVRLAAAERLGLLGGEPAESALLAAALDDAQPMVRARALRRAGDLLTEQELSARLRGQLWTPPAERRAMALHALAKLPGRIPRDDAMRLAADAELEVRRALAQVAVDAVDAPADVLALLLDDDDHEVRHAAFVSARTLRRTRWPARAD